MRKYKPDVLAGIELRGFLLAAPLALALGTGFVMLRKKGKLPGITVRHTYALEYGTDTIEIQSDAIDKGKRVVLVDDLLATGGTMAAAVPCSSRSAPSSRRPPASSSSPSSTAASGSRSPVEALLSYDSVVAGELETQSDKSGAGDGFERAPDRPAAHEVASQRDRDCIGEQPDEGHGAEHHAENASD